MSLEDLVQFPALFDDAAFEAVLTTWTQKAAGIPAVFDAENGPQMDRTYALFTIMSAEDVTGTNEMFEPEDGDDDVVHKGYYKLEYVRVQVEVIADSNKPGRSAAWYCRRLQAALGSELYKQELFLPNDIGIQNAGNVKRVPLLEDNVRWRSRAMFEAVFNVACNASAVEILPTVSTVRADGELNYATPTDPLTGTLSVTAVSE
jgi:hypothetical protein